MRDYRKNPLIVYWEMTQACALACRHCRAQAIPTGRPGELTFEQGKQLLRQIVGFGEPLPFLVLTGGDPLKRPDIFPLIDEARALGLEVSITPSATATLTPEVMLKLKEHGIQSIGLSLDGSNALRHEAIRGVIGCFDWTIAAIRAAAEVGLPVQINTLVCQETADDLESIYRLLTTMKVMRWSLFFLISVGRGKALQELSPRSGERLMSWVYDRARVAPFLIKTTEAPYYRRVALHRMQEEKASAQQTQAAALYNGFGIRDGNGIVFISSKGDICPAGFLPQSAGNVKTDLLPDIYRESELFRALHDPDQFQGKCGTCEYRMLCGGSRSRAFAHTGNALESDPFCGYQPHQ